MMNNDELEAYLRKHTLNGQMREIHDAWGVLWRITVQDAKHLWMRILNILGI